MITVAVAFLACLLLNSIVLPVLCLPLLAFKRVRGAA